MMNLELDEAGDVAFGAGAELAPDAIESRMEMLLVMIVNLTMAR